MAGAPRSTTLRRLEPGPLIRDARTAAGLSQAELAERVGTKQTVISRWERGVDEPRLSTLGRVLRACGFEADITFRSRDDVDRSQIALLRAMTPAQRARHHASAAATVARARRARRVG